ncbi:39S ribosomal protein L45 [Massilia sp. P8910]|uniref:Tim44 domain-containing protein n=1 Tax=Massilia antarctica TaxID=2765360 RepID=UPI001E5AA82E|nr:Tim44-like domain-containing protein [Massilia antarctica]MCE3606673.1 39S ribosomal protein L45 [Massilia antarctica]
MKKLIASAIFAMAALSCEACAQQPGSATIMGYPSHFVIGGGVMLASFAGFLGARALMRKKGRAAAPVAQPVSTKPAFPPGFDNTAFLRQAKATFIRMQKTWDKADASDLRQFTTPQVFAELQPQMQAPGASVTEVVAIESELLGVETVGDVFLATVRFSGQIRTAPGAAPEPLAEVWNMSRPLKGGGDWKLAGIGQLS